MRTSHLDLARELAAEIRSRGDEIELARQVPADIIDSLRQGGVFRLCTPKALGGSEVPALETLR
ncbi:MAG: acyl-CoA dehydrogenase, partial [Deltaproteobacteria bacterium]|nr:acyl-CoA dehydrogenase [Deltaproteobacteria bacterium]